jgi:hypothetical protein
MSSYTVVANPAGATIATPVITYYAASDTQRKHPMHTAPSAVCSYFFVATYAGNSNYVASSTTAPFVITKAIK